MKNCVVIFSRMQRHFGPKHKDIHLLFLNRNVTNFSSSLQKILCKDPSLKNLDIRLEEHTYFLGKAYLFLY